ncbi:sulfite reductase [Achromatium sp. WMS1]|nr:sulfite reductase [Achromatium sp. WMS1]
MASTMREIMNPNLPTGGRPGFPDAPEDWNEENASSMAKADEIELEDDHWEVIRALHNYFSRHDRMNLRELNDALEEKFYAKGGIKYLYELFPGGPITQGCKLAGIELPKGTLDPS